MLTTCKAKNLNLSGHNNSTNLGGDPRGLLQLLKNM